MKLQTDVSVQYARRTQRSPFFRKFSDSPYNLYQDYSVGPGYYNSCVRILSSTALRPEKTTTYTSSRY